MQKFALALRRSRAASLQQRRPAMHLAKPCIDIGLNTANAESMLAFWSDEIGLVYEGPLTVRRAVIQHRFECDGSIIKVNAYAAGVSAELRSGYRELIVAKSKIVARTHLHDPNGNAVCLWPAGDRGMFQIGVRMGVRDLSRHRTFFGEVLGLLEVQPSSSYSGSTCFSIGQSRLILEEDPSASVDAGFAGGGWRYITFQVFNVDEVHAGLLAKGAREAMAPKTLGRTARISMVLDPDGNWIEISQRASLVGSLE
jgi:catechol 2,3-dioxygenase-like lactoylglutathione lyase family enzyme